MRIIDIDFDTILLAKNHMKTFDLQYFIQNCYGQYPLRFRFGKTERLIKT